MSGTGDANPFRIRPIVGAKVPFNGTVVSPILLHNPYPTGIQVTEIQSSAANVHVEVDPDHPGRPPKKDYWVCFCIC